MPICYKNKRCQITKTSRNNCAPCRFSKCVRVGMRTHLVQSDDHQPGIRPTVSAVVTSQASFNEFNESGLWSGQASSQDFNFNGHRSRQLVETVSNTPLSQCSGSSQDSNFFNTTTGSHSTTDIVTNASLSSNMGFNYANNGTTIHGALDACNRLSGQSQFSNWSQVNAHFQPNAGSPNGASSSYGSSPISSQIFSYSTNSLSGSM